MLEEPRDEDAENLRSRKDQIAPALTALTAVRPASPARIIRLDMRRGARADGSDAAWGVGIFWGELIILSLSLPLSTDGDWEPENGSGSAMLCVSCFNEVSL